MPLRLAALALALLAACGRAELDGAEQILVPDDVVVAWDRTFDAEGDGIGALVQIDVMAYETGTGEPVPGVELEIRSAGVDILLPEDVVLVDPESGALEDLRWDVRQELAFVVSADPRGAVGLSTDEDGLARVLAWADAFPPAEEGFGPVAVVIATRDADEVFHLVPQ